MLRRKRLAMLVAEFLGTGVLTLVVLSIQRSQLGLSYFVAIGAGLAVAMLTYVLGNVSGAQLNPALTIGLWASRRVKTVPAIVYLVAQLLGAWAAYGVYHYVVHTEVQAINQAFQWRLLVAELVGTMVFAMGWAAAAYNRFEEGRFASLAGISFAVGVIVASAGSVGLINPALAEGVRAWEVFGQNGWGNYVVGPVVGAIVGVFLYGLLFADSDRPFGARRGRSAAAGAATVTTSGAVVRDTDAESFGDEADGETSSRGKKTRKVAATPAGATKVSRAKKTSTKRVSTSSKRKR